MQNDYSEMDRFELRMRRFYYVHHIKCCVTEKMIISFFSKNDFNARIAYVELDVAFWIGFGFERLGR